MERNAAPKGHKAFEVTKRVYGLALSGSILFIMSLSFNSYKLMNAEQRNECVYSLL
jgi:hypothetical protein